MKQYQLLHKTPWEELIPDNKIRAFNYDLPIVPKDWRPEVPRTVAGSVHLNGLLRRPAPDRARYYHQLLARHEGAVFPFVLVQPPALRWNSYMIDRWGEQPPDSVITTLGESREKPWKQIEVELELFDMFDENLPFLINIASQAGHPHRTDALDYLYAHWKRR